MLKIGALAPQFKLKSTENIEVSLDDFKGKWLIFYFYPKDNTPGCSIEGRDFSCLIDEFNNEGASIVGVSPDSIESHTRFIEKKDLKFQLLSDPDKQALKDYEALSKKGLIGKLTGGVTRSTFIIDPNGRIAKVYYSISHKGHANQVLEDLKMLKLQATTD